MNLKKIAIPAVTPGLIQNSTEHARFLDAVKQNLDVITSRVQGLSEIDPLPANATNAQIINTLNRIVARLNASGQGEGI